LQSAAGFVCYAVEFSSATKISEFVLQQEDCGEGAPRLGPGDPAAVSRLHIMRGDSGED
jgi:hypothetical protein